MELARLGIIVSTYAAMYPKRVGYRIALRMYIRREYNYGTANP
jgi:hypothetical protein